MQLHPPRFDQAQILVVGDVMLDRYWQGSTSRISPEAPVPVVKVEDDEGRPGGAANVALNIAALGGGASLIASVGADTAADSLKNCLQGVGVHTDFQVSLAKPTITKLRVMSRHQQLIRLDFEEAFTAEDSCEFVNKADRLLKNVSVLVLSDYAKGTLQDTQGLIAAARTAGVKVLVDPKGSDFEKYRGATLLTPNLSEFEAVVGHCSSELDLVEKGNQLIAKLELDALLITRSEKGMTLLRFNQPELHFPARSREVFDVTGAGDTVIATLAAALAADEPLPQAVALANIAASIVVEKLGTATVSAPELRRAVQREQGAERGVLSDEQLLMMVKDARAHGEKIVFTNGCFDIIHAGHVGYLEDAAKLGHRLIVAINSDASIRRLKGPERPINPLDRRLTVLAALESTDWVVSYDDDTPERLLSLLQPDIVVKGGDYTKQEVVGWEIVQGYGGDVRVLNFLDDCSTTAIVDKIKDDKH